jgi:hypothetical protein
MSLQRSGALGFLQRNHDYTFAPAAVDFDSLGYQPREQAVAVAPQCGATLGCSHRGLLFLILWSVHLGDTLFSFVHQPERSRDQHTE